MLYWPCESDTTVRTFSISAGLDASTVTPGRTPPEVSCTTPAMPCANVAAGVQSRIPQAKTPTVLKCLGHIMLPPSCAASRALRSCTFSCEARNPSSGCRRLILTNFRYRVVPDSVGKDSVGKLCDYC